MERIKAIWYYGKTGCGKSYKAFENYDSNTHFVYQNNLGFKFYNNQSFIIIVDDIKNNFDKLLLFINSNIIEKIIVDDIKINFDKLMLLFNSTIIKNIIITNLLHPNDIYKNIDHNKLIDLFKKFEIIKLDSINQ